MNKLELISGPAVDVVDIQDVKDFIRISGDDDDAQVSMFIKAATRMLEFYLNRKFINQSWAVWFNGFCSKEKDIWWDGQREGSILELVEFSNKFKLPLSPTYAVSSVKFYDVDDVETVVASSVYQLEKNGDHSSVALRYGESWPTLVLRALDSVRIECVFGYGADPSAVPEELKAAIMAAVAGMYECKGSGMKISEGVLGMVSHLRVHNV